MLRAVARGRPSGIWRRIYAVPDAGAGNDVTFAVPQHRCWQLLGVAGIFTASAVAGNRLPALTLEDAEGTPLAKIACPTNITANLAPQVSWTPGVGSAVVVAASFAALTLPEAWYMNPQEILTLTGHTDVGDTWTKVRVTVLETNTGNPDYEREIEQSIVDHWQAMHELIEIGSP